MEATENFAKVLMCSADDVSIPEGEMCAWVDCCNCQWGEWNPDQGAYWCRRWKEHTVQQGCSFGVEV